MWDPTKEGGYGNAQKQTHSVGLSKRRGAKKMHYGKELLVLWVANQGTSKSKHSREPSKHTLLGLQKERG